MNQNPVSSLYKKRIQEQRLAPDPGQLPVLDRLDALAINLTQPRRWWQRGTGARGIYMHGAVGRGKTMLMDMFFAAAAAEPKQRVHFHGFMLDVHRRMHEARRRSSSDPLAEVASVLAKEARLLCLDEFMVKDVADAMILSRLFTALIDKGVVVVATSNMPPDELYRDGLQRELFLPFIQLLKHKLDIVAIAPGDDHRLARLAGRPVYFHPDDAVAAWAMDAAFVDLADGLTPHQEEIDVGERSVLVKRAAGQVARFTFDELCRRPMSAADYKAIIMRFSIVIVDHVPVFRAENRNEATRFITLIDQLYDSGRKLIASAAAAPPDLYPPNGPLAGDFRRTASRLIEMQSRDYLAR